MADAASAGHQLKSSFRCRRCRHSLLQGDAAELDEGCSLCPMGEAQSPVWYLQEVNVPTWIHNCIEEASWTKGKLLCPKCGGRLGSFDFTLQAKCGLGLHPVPCVHLVRSRVDRFMASPPVARVKPFQTEEKPSSDLPFENHTDPVFLCSKHDGVREESDLCNVEFCWQSSSLTKENGSTRNNVLTNCGHQHRITDDSSVDDTNSEQLKKPPSENDKFLLEMFNRDNETVTNYITSKLRDDKERKVQYCHHSCLLYPQVHSNCSATMRDECHLVPEQPLSRLPINSIGSNESTFIDDNSDTVGAQTLQSETNLLMNSWDNLSSGDTANHETATEEEVTVSSPLIRENPEDFLLHDWDLLEDLDEINSSIYPSHTRAELKREKNRRRREKRKLKKRGNMCFQVLDQDIKGIPPSKFEELTGLSLGDKTVQEYLICSVCLDLFFNPRACSPCGHLFCEQCLRQLTRFNPASTPCPLCRTVIQVTIPHESLNNALRKLFPVQTKQRREAHGGVNQVYPLPRTQSIPSVWLPLFSQQMMRGRNRRRMFWSLQPNSTLDYHDFGRLWVQTLRWRFTVAGYGLLALLFVCACSVLVINFV